MPGGPEPGCRVARSRDAGWPGAGMPGGPEPGGAGLSGPGPGATDAADEVRPQPARLARQLQVVHPVEQGLEHQPQLHPGQPCPEAQVRAVAAERHVVVVVAGQVTAEGTGKGGLVVVGRVGAT